MYEAFWNGLLDVRWEDAPLGPETTRLVLRKGFAMTRSSRTSPAVTFRCAAAAGARRAGDKSRSEEAWRTCARCFARKARSLRLCLTSRPIRN